MPIAPIVSPNTTNASRTVTSGSTVARIDDRVGPTRARPAKKSAIEATVETPARHSSHHQPATVSAPG